MDIKTTWMKKNVKNFVKNRVKNVQDFSFDGGALVKERVISLILNQHGVKQELPGKDVFLDNLQLLHISSMLDLKNLFVPVWMDTLMDKTALFQNSNHLV
jgi:hypothetical protein